MLGFELNCFLRVDVLGKHQYQTIANYFPIVVGSIGILKRIIGEGV